MQYSLGEIKALMKMAFKAGKKRGEEEEGLRWTVDLFKESEITYQNLNFEEWFEKTFPSKSVMRRIKHQIKDK